MLWHCKLQMIELQDWAGFKTAGMLWTIIQVNIIFKTVF